MNYFEEEPCGTYEDDVVNGYDGHVWWRTYNCPICNYEDEVKCTTAYAPTLFCPNCGTMMN